MSPVLGFRLGYFLSSLKELKQTNLSNLFDGTVEVLKRFLSEKLQQIFAKRPAGDIQEYCYAFMVNLYSIINKVVGIDVMDIEEWKTQLMNLGGNWKRLLHSWIEWDFYFFYNSKNKIKYNTIVYTQHYKYHFNSNFQELQILYLFHVKFI